MCIEPALDDPMRLHIWRHSQQTVPRKWQLWTGEIWLSCYQQTVNPVDSLDTRDSWHVASVKRHYRKVPVEECSCRRYSLAREPFQTKMVSVRHRLLKAVRVYSKTQSWSDARVSFVGAARMCEAKAAKVSGKGKTNWAEMCQKVTTRRCAGGKKKGMERYPYL